MNRWAINAESVGQCEPRVCFETLGSNITVEIVRNPEGVARLAVNKRRRNSYRVAPSRNGMRFPRVAKAHPGLELANAFSVIHNAQIQSFDTDLQPTNPLLSEAR